MILGLQAPAAVPVEVRTATRRVFRMSTLLGSEEVRLARPAPFERGEPVDITLTIPDTDLRLKLRAEVTMIDDESEEDGDAGGCGLRLIDPLPDAKWALAGYVARRLGLPPL